MSDEILALVLGAVRSLGEDMDKDVLVAADEETRLFGSKGTLDSLGLVALIADVEDLVFEKFAKSVTLADEKSMSQARSPFRDVRSLAGYVEKLMAESDG